MPEAKQFTHIFLRDRTRTEEYAYPGGGGESKDLPPRDRVTHAERLRTQLDQAKVHARERSEQVASAWALPAKRGVHLEFESEPGFELAIRSLEDARQGIELVAFRELVVDQDGEEKRVGVATVYLPPGKLKSLERKIQDYATQDTKGTETSGPRPRHEKMLASLAELRLATLKSFWTDEPSLLPRSQESIWWEVWLRSPDQVALEDFRATMAHLGVSLRIESLEFLETRVLLAYGTLEQLSVSVDVVDSIAELRRAKELPSFFKDMPRGDLGLWIKDLIDRTHVPSPSSPRLCLYDTGVNSGHPLLKPGLRLSDCHAVDPDWGVDDRDGHGTGMAGLALYGDLTSALVGNDRLLLPAQLESVKIVPPPPQFNEPDLYGKITQQAAYRVEVEAPLVRRTHALTVTAKDGRERGRPSSWSASLDQLAYGRDDEPERLWVVSAGNAFPEDRQAWVRRCQ